MGPHFTAPAPVLNGFWSGVFDVECVPLCFFSLFCLTWFSDPPPEERPRHPPPPPPFATVTSPPLCMGCGVFLHLYGLWGVQPATRPGRPPVSVLCWFSCFVWLFVREVCVAPFNPCGLAVFFPPAPSLPFLFFELPPLVGCRCVVFPLKRLPLPPSLDRFPSPSCWVRPQSQPLPPGVINSSKNQLIPRPKNKRADRRPTRLFPPKPLHFWPRGWAHF